MSQKYKRDDFGDRMKTYERLAESQLIPNLPIVVRLDGKSFSKYTSRLERPYDLKLIELMQNTCKHLMKISHNIKVAYQQSDEITLIISNDYDNPVEYNGRVQKLCSILAAECSVYFATHAYILENALHDHPVFDCRIFNVPDWVEASNAVLWREQDATKNSIQLAGQSNFSHKEMQGLKNNQVQEKLLLEKNINWNDYTASFKRGSYIKREKYFDPNLNTERSHFVVKDFGQPLSKFTLEERLELLFS